MRAGAKTGPGPGPGPPGAVALGLWGQEGLRWRRQRWGRFVPLGCALRASGERGALLGTVPVAAPICAGRQVINKSSKGVLGQAFRRICRYSAPQLTLT